jgi:hypothetical protein
LEVAKLGEYGYEWSALGFSLSYNSTIERSKQVMPKYAFGIPGESKFLEMIMLWVDVTAPRYWWQEADTYRVGTCKQSESTMHTIRKKKLDQDNFEDDVPEFMIDFLNVMIEGGAKLVEIKNVLPEGFLQRRIWMFSYKTLQWIYIQRINHKLPQWQKFLNGLVNQVDYPEFIVKDYSVEKEQI